MWLRLKAAFAAFWNVLTDKNFRGDFAKMRPTHGYMTQKEIDSQTTLIN